MDVIIWSMLEVFVAVMCACLMAIRPLLVKCMPASFTSMLASRKHTYGDASRRESRPTRNSNARWNTSVVELKSTGSGAGWADEGGSGDDKQPQERPGDGPLEVWVKKSVEMG